MVWTEAGELFTFGRGEESQLGHGGEENERVPRLVEALVGKQVVGATAGGDHTAVWTEAGELFTFGLGEYGQNRDFVPRLVNALAGKKVVGAAVASQHTVVWTDAGELFTFGWGYYGQLGHGGEEHVDFSPRLGQFAGKTMLLRGTAHIIYRTAASTAAVRAELVEALLALGA